jgi:hypothetical protein
MTTKALKRRLDRCEAAEQLAIDDHKLARDTWLRVVTRENPGSDTPRSMSHLAKRLEKIHVEAIQTLSAAKYDSRKARIELQRIEEARP